MYCCVIFLGLPQQITTKLAKQKYTLTVLEARGPKSGVTVTVLPPWRARAPSLAWPCSLPDVPMLPPWRARAPSQGCRGGSVPFLSQGWRLLAFLGLWPHRSASTVTLLPPLLPVSSEPLLSLSLDLAATWRIYPGGMTLGLALETGTTVVSQAKFSSQEP